MDAGDGIDAECAGNETHNWLSICEGYHSPILPTVRKILMEYQKADLELVLELKAK